MLRELNVTMNKPANTMYSCAEDKVITGMAVVLDDTAMTFGFAEAATAEGIYFVDRVPEARGINAALENMSDYHEDFTTVFVGEKAKVIALYKGEEIATENVASGLAVGDYLKADETGKMVKSETATAYKYAGEYMDGTHKLYIVKAIA